MNRSRFEIIAGIMQNCLLPRGKTHIMYKGNLSFTQTNAYLSLLTSLRLLSQTDSKYETTDKGRQFLSAYNELGKIIGIPAPPSTKMEFMHGIKAEERLKRIG
jgi:predicted transcriptional regulator